MRCFDSDCTSSRSLLIFYLKTLNDNVKHTDIQLYIKQTNDTYLFLSAIIRTFIKRLKVLSIPIGPKCAELFVLGI